MFTIDSEYLWLYNHRMRAVSLFGEKRLVTNRNEKDFAVVEIKIWKVPKSEYYQEGRKFSLFLVYLGEVVIGIDNHKPKGPNLHLGNKKVPYDFKDEETLLVDFWDLVRKAGFEP